MADKPGAVLVIGAGVGGMRAALDLAESGFRAYLVDNRPGVGGTVPQLDKWFPDNGCELCKLLPVFDRDDCTQVCLRRDIGHPKVDLLPNSVVEGLSGKAGDFRASVRTESRWVRAERCTGCGLCAEVCPVEVPDEYNEGLTMRKAAYVRTPQSIPHFYAIDREACTRCGECVKVCPTNAIELDMPDETRDLEVGAVIISSGFHEFDAARMGQYGFGRHANVLNNLQVERMLSSNGATGGRLLRPSDGEVPRRVAILQCIGSRDSERMYCSSACCMYALKEAILIKEKYPETEVSIYYMDLRAFGKGYHRYYMKAQDMGISFIRCRVSLVRQDPQTKNLLLMARAEDGAEIDAEAGMVVLSAAQCPSSKTAELADALGIDLGQWGFVRLPETGRTCTSREGVFVCGSAAAPADIADTVVQASAAAGEAHALLAAAREASPEFEPEATPPAGDEEARVAVFICQCGQEVASVVDTAKVAEALRALPGVVSVQETPFLCLPETLDEVKRAVAASGANRVILAACAPYHYHRLFARAMKEAGIDPSWWRLVNIREQLAWVHRDFPAAATEKAERVLRVAIDRLRGQERLVTTPLPVEQTALVIGAGVSGMATALRLADQGFEVHLVERSAGPGGHAAGVRYSLGMEDAQAVVTDLRERVAAEPRVHLRTESEVTGMTGRAGDFRSSIRGADGDVGEIRHGAVIVATGAEDYVPTEYGYGESQQVLTQRELQQRLADGSLGVPSAVVMIQCVGSRDEEHPYCNRTCCSDAIANALRIKEQSPETQVFVLNRDIMTYGMREEHYLRAREAGVLFIRYDLESRPQVTAEDGKVSVVVDDPVLPGKLEIEADLLVLSTGIVAGDNRPLADMLSLDLTQDGFFREVDTKFRPVDAVIDGVYVCGRANAPLNLGEELVQARAAAQRAANVLSRRQLRSGRVVSEVNARRCSGCQICVTTCPFSARWMDEERRIAVVDEALCQACGSCVAACPNSAARLRGYRDKELLSAVEAAL